MVTLSMTDSPPTDKGFVHLHVHTEFSLLDGLSKIKKLVARAEKLGQTALAITDHGTMYGVMDFYSACVDKKIQPILGMESYLSPRRMTDRDPQLDRRPNHLLLLARNLTGYQNLLKIASSAQLEGYYYRPRIDFEFLAEHADGLVSTTGCLAARVPQYIMQGKHKEAEEWIGKFSEVLGRENFFLELQHHDIPELHPVNKWLIEYARRNPDGPRLLATNDVHYIESGDFEAHDTLLCIQTQALKAEPKRKDHDDENDRGRMAMSDNSYYLSSAEEMWKIFGDETPDALTSTLDVAQQCAFTFPERVYKFPKFPVPVGFDSESYLRHLCELGMVWRFGSHADDPKLRERLDYELNVIKSMGYNTYFLIVWDLCEYARQTDIWFNVRGSGAGSLALYALGITNIDPIQNALFFERFLNPERKTMPDIDIDYPDDRRSEMLAYAVQKYGSEKVAAIITFGTLGAKQAVRDVARTMGVDLSHVDRAAKLIPQEPKPKPIEKYIEEIPDLKKVYDEDPELRGVLDMAGKLQGARRHASVHAAGVIIADQPLVEYLPLHRMTGKENADLPIKQVTQFTMETCEAIGLLKIDFLGLSTLTILRTACELIERYHGISYRMENIPYRHDDPRLTEDDRKRLDEAFQLIARGDTVGVFQLESSGMQTMLRDMRPREFENIVAGVSLYRPGPLQFIPDYNRRLHGEEETEYLHPKLEPIVGVTYGILVYQEQIMQVARDLFGYRLGEADLMRRAVSKKKKEDLDKHRTLFRERGPENGIDVEVADKIFDQIDFFANYGFNKAHAADYAVLSVQTAFLKRHYPHEYMAALLTVQRDDSVKVAVFLEDSRRMNIPILPPDVNHGDINFTIENMADERRGIRFGLVAIKNAGEGAVRPIIAERQEHGPFRDLDDLAKRVDLRRVGKRTIEALAQAGALDSIHPDRQQIIENADTLMAFSGREWEDKATGQMSLFGGDAASEESRLKLSPVKTRKSAREILMAEKELLGVYVSGRPIDKYRADLAGTRTAEIATLRAEPEYWREQDVRIAGEVVSFRKVYTKNKDAMGILQIEDWHDSAGVIEVVLFPKTFKMVEAQVASEDIKPLGEGEVYVISGKFDASRGEPQIVADRITSDFTVMTVDSSADSYSSRPLETPDWAVGNTFDHREPPPPSGDDEVVDVGYVPAAARTIPVPPTSVTDMPLPPDAPDWMRGSSSQTARWLTITLPRTGDPERDVRLLKRVHGLATSVPGSDYFVVRVVVDGQAHLAHFRDTIDIPGAIAQLRAVVGEGDFSVTDAPPAGAIVHDETDGTHNGSGNGKRRSA
jgi:DNA polymerase-3 subunit alpha